MITRQTKLSGTFRTLNECHDTSHLGINLLHVLDEVNDTVGIAVLVVVPGDDLDEGVAELDSSLGVKDGRPDISNEVLGHNIVLSVAEVALKVSGFGRSLHGSLDIFVLAALVEPDSKVNNGDIGGGDTEGHSGELTIKLGDDLADSLSGSGGGGDDVLASATATTPILGGGTVNGLLGGGGGVDGGHETFLNSELVVEDLGDGSQAVGGAGGVGDDVHVLGILLLVDTHHEHGGIGGGGGDDDLLGTTFVVSICLIEGGEDASRFDDVFSTSAAPGDGFRLHLVEDLDLVSVDNEVIAFSVDVVVNGHKIKVFNEMKTLILCPLTTRSLPSAWTSPLNTPWVESYLNM